MNKVVSLKQDADMADVFLSLDATEDFVLTDPEGIRLFRLNPLEKSQLGNVVVLHEILNKFYFHLSDSLKASK